MKLLSLAIAFMVTLAVPSHTTTQVLSQSVSQTLRILDQDAAQELLRSVYFIIMAEQIENIEAEKFSFSISYPERLQLQVSADSISAILHARYTVHYNDSPINCIDLDTSKVTNDRLCYLKYKNILNFKETEPDKSAVDLVKSMSI